MGFNGIYHLVMTHSSPWYRWPIYRWFTHLPRFSWWDALGINGYPLVNVYIANWKIPSYLMGKLTISMAMFNSYVKLPEGKYQWDNHHKYLVGGWATNPSEKWWTEFVSWGYNIPNTMGKSIQIPWFQTTNQIPMGKYSNKGSHPMDHTFFPTIKYPQLDIFRKIEVCKIQSEYIYIYSYMWN